MWKCLDIDIIPTPMNKELSAKIEAILFYKNEPLTYKELSKILRVSEEEVKEGVQILKESLKGRGVALIETEKEVALATAPELTEMIEKISKDEMNSEIGKAGLETLAIILYNGPISRREIEYIRGVNSSHTVRMLSIRGLIKKEGEGRSPKYSSSIELLAHLGIAHTNDLPEFEKVKQELSQAEQAAETL